MQMALVSLPLTLIDAIPVALYVKYCWKEHMEVEEAQTSSVWVVIENPGRNHSFRVGSTRFMAIAS
jgi:hypothetical protein